MGEIPFCKKFISLKLVGCFGFNGLLIQYFSLYPAVSQGEVGWSGGAMVLGKLPVPGRPTIWIK